MITGESWNCCVENWTLDSREHPSQLCNWQHQAKDWYADFGDQATEVQRYSGVLLWGRAQFQGPGCQSCHCRRILFPLSYCLLSSPACWLKSGCTKSLHFNGACSGGKHYYKRETGHHPWGLALGFPNTQSNVSKTASLCIAEHSTEKNHVGALFSFVARYF